MMKGLKSKITGTLITIPAALILCALSACESQLSPAPTSAEQPAEYAVGGLSVVVNDATLSDIPKNFYIIGTLMLPLNDICEALGFEVELIENGASFTVSDGTRGTKAVIGENKYTKMSDTQEGGDTEVLMLGEAPLLVDGAIFVPAEFFHQVLGESYLIENGVVTFTGGFHSR